MKWGQNGGKQEQEASVRLKNRLRRSGRLKELKQWEVVVNLPTQKETF